MFNQCDFQSLLIKFEKNIFTHKTQNTQKYFLTIFADLRMSDTKYEYTLELSLKISLKDDHIS